MTDKQAFAALLASVESALGESFQRANAATERGDFDAADVEHERQRNLVGVRDQLQVLQDVWPKLVGTPRRGRRKRTTPSTQPPKGDERLRKGLKTTEEAFRLPILAALEELGGQARKGDVVRLVEGRVGGRLNDYDHQQLKNGQVRWENTVAWSRQRLKDRGLLAADSPRGVWEITDAGREYLAEHRGEV